MIIKSDKQIIILDDEATVATLQQGKITVTFQELYDAFGLPNVERKEGDAEDAMWFIYTQDGYVSIYNHKDGKNFLGEEGLPTNKITEWNIGGENEKIVDQIYKALNKIRE